MTPALDPLALRLGAAENFIDPVDHYKATIEPFWNNASHEKGSAGFTLGISLRGYVAFITAAASQRQAYLAKQC